MHGMSTPIKTILHSSLGRGREEPMMAVGPDRQTGISVTPGLTYNPSALTG